MVADDRLLVRTENATGKEEEQRGTSRARKRTGGAAVTPPEDSLRNWGARTHGKMAGGLSGGIHETLYQLADLPALRETILPGAEGSSEQSRNKQTQKRFLLQELGMGRSWRHNRGVLRVSLRKCLLHKGKAKEVPWERAIYIAF